MTEPGQARLAVLASVVSATVRHFNLDEVMQTALERLTESFGVDLGTIQLREGDHLVLVAHRGVHPDTAKELGRVPLELDRFSTRAVRDNEALRVDGMNTAGFEHSQPAHVRERLASIVAVPIPGPGRAAGVLVLGSRVGGRPLSEVDMELMEAVASQVGVAIENSRLYAEVRAQEANLEAQVEERTRQLADAQEQLMRRERLASLGQLAGSLGHDLRGPLINLEMGLELLSTEEDADERARMAERLRQELRRANRLIEGLLDFARSKEPNRVRMGLGAVLHQATAWLRSQYPDLDLVVEIEDHPPLQLDPDQQLRLFENLLRNAVEAAGPGGRVQVTLKNLGSEIVVRVEDSGEGIDPSETERIFEPLVTKRRKGTGLGLAICKRTVEAHGGRIRVCAGRLKGACLEISYPVEDRA